MDDLPICVTCGVQYPADHDTDALPDLRGRPAVRRARRPAVDHPRRAAGRATATEFARRGYRPDRHRHRRRSSPSASGRCCCRARAATCCGTASSLIDDETVDKVNELGGVSAIAISHPHYYSSMVEWSEAFGGVPIYLHAADRAVGAAHRERGVLGGRTEEILPGRTLLNPRIHFDGGTVAALGGRRARPRMRCAPATSSRSCRPPVGQLHVQLPQLHPRASGHGPRGRCSWSSRFEYDVIYGAWWDMVVEQDAKAALTRSARRYLRAPRDAALHTCRRRDRANVADAVEVRVGDTNVTAPVVAVDELHPRNTLPQRSRRSTGSGGSCGATDTPDCGR